MSLLSDRQIRERSIRPNYRTVTEITNELLGTNEFIMENFLFSNNPPALRRIKAIERAVEIHNLQDLPMIHPFEEGQVRERNVHTLRSLTKDILNEPNHSTIDSFPNLPAHIAAGVVDEIELTSRAIAQQRLDKMIADGTMPKEKIISYGTSSYGYDVRCAPEFKIFTNINSTIVDPKNFDDKCFVDFEGPECIIPPNSFALARTVEYFRIPRDVLVVCLGKSTYARCGIIVNVTPLEPEWEGHVTLEFSNTTPLPARIYANEGVAQMLFFKTDEPCVTSYKDRGGKYQGQVGVTIPKV
jgi:dCTP deaminase